MQRIECSFLDEVGLLTALNKCRPDLFARLDEDEDPEDAAREDDADEPESSACVVVSDDGAGAPMVPTDAEAYAAENEQAVAT